MRRDCFVLCHRPPTSFGILGIRLQLAPSKPICVERATEVISVNNWDAYDLFVHSPRTPNSPAVWSSAPLPSHYTWAYVCGQQGRWDCGRSTSVFRHVDLVYVIAWLTGAAGTTCCHTVGSCTPVSSHWRRHQNITAWLQPSANKGQGLVATTESRVNKRSSNLIRILPTEIRI